LDFQDKLPRRLLLLPGLESSELHSLKEQVLIELRPPPVSAPSATLVPIPLPGGGRKLAGGGAQQTTSWRLTLQQALAASTTPEASWKGREPLSWEQGKPAFKADKRLTARDWPVLAKGDQPRGFLSVRRSASDGSVQRALVVGTDLGLSAVSTAAGVRVKVRSLASGRPLAGCALTLHGLVGAFGDKVKSDAKGEALLPWGPAEKRPDPLFLVASLPSRKPSSSLDQTFTPLQPIPKATPRPPVGFLITDRPHYAAEQDVTIRGFLWKKPGPGAHRSLKLALFGEDGEVASSTTVSVAENGFWEGVCRAPKAEGRYTLELEVPGGERTRTQFRVCPKAQEEESYTLELVKKPDDGFSATLAREGARHRAVGLRAYLLPLAERNSEVQGWTPLTGQQAAWTPLGTTTKDQQLSFKVPGPAGGGTLIVEAFDADQPTLILARTHQELVVTEPFLALSFEQRESGPGLQTVLPLVRGWQGATADISGVLMMRSSAFPDWKEVETRPALQEPWSFRLREPGEYRLLWRAALLGGPVVEGIWEREVSAADLADPELTVEPPVAMPGATLLPFMPARDGGKEFWMRTISGAFEEGRFATAGGDGKLPPWTVDFARALAVSISTEVAEAPKWGRQRARWRRRRTPVPLGQLSRRADLSLSVQRADGVNAPVQAGQSLRVTTQLNGPGDGWTGVVLCNPTLAGWPAPAPPMLSSFLGTPPPVSVLPDTYPLLTPSTDAATLARSGMALDPEASVVMPAPNAAGTYRWWAIARDDLGRFGWAETTTEVGEISRWSAFAPWGARAGDSFEAGVRFVSGPSESGPLGLTATALVGAGRLSPTGYQRTAGVVKPANTYLLGFRYQLGQEVKDPVRLAWELGHGGKLHQQDAVLEVFDSPPVPRGLGLAGLSRGAIRRVPVPGALPWRLTLRPPEKSDEEALIQLHGPRGSLGKVRLKAGSPPVPLQGAGPGTVQIEHIGGPPIAYEMSRLEPDQGATQAWAAQLYLFRHLVDASGTAVDAAVVGESYRVRIDLVNPSALPTARLRIPLPGGIRPLALEAAREGTPTPDWRVSAGEVEFELEDLAEGEFVWELVVEAQVAGDYLWPTALATTADGSLQALSGSSRLVVLAK
jgi:hypothetical protein